MSDDLDPRVAAYLAPLPPVARLGVSVPGQNGPGPPDAVRPWSPASILDGVDLDAPPPAPELLGLIYPGKFHLVSGRPETAKTWFALAVVDETMRAGGAALVLDTDGGGQRDLAMRLVVDFGLDPDLARQVGYSDDPREWFGTDAAREDVTGWCERMAERGPVVVVIDTLNPTIAALGHKLDEVGMVALEAAVIAPLKRAGAAVIGPDHVAIHAAADSPYSIGTQRKHGAADVHLRLTQTGAALMRGGPPATFVIAGMKDKPGGIERRGTSRHVGKVTFTPGPAGSGVTYDVDLSPPSAQEARAIFRPTWLMERVSTWAAVQPGTFSKRDVDAEVKGKAQPLRTAVDVLLTEGYLVPEGDRYRHALRYVQADDPEAENGRDAPPPASPGASPGRGGTNRAEGASPRPADNHAGSQGASHPRGRARPETGGGGASPASPPSKGTRYDAPPDADLDRWEQLRSGEG